MHKRKQIRYAVAKFLEAGDITEVKTGSGQTATYRIFANRPTPVWESELPAIFVYTGTGPSGSESADLNERPTIYKRSLKLVIEIVCEDSELVDDVLDGITEKVEQIVGDFQNLFASQSVKNSDNSLITDVGIIDLNSTDIRLVDDGKQIVGSCKLIFDVPYFAGLGTALETGDSPKIVHTDFADSTDPTVILAETEQDLAPENPPYIVADFTWVGAPNVNQPVDFLNESTPVGTLWSWKIKNHSTEEYDLEFSTIENPENIDLLSYGAQYFTGGIVEVKLTVQGRYVCEKQMIVGN